MRDLNFNSPLKRNPSISLNINTLGMFLGIRNVEREREREQNEFDSIKSWRYYYLMDQLRIDIKRLTRVQAI